ncbi:Hypothetical Protein FCC1311_059592 [Hondaea fermentalgiana]|uniref:Uncharacterized protein n=1 Tax=Hondaea fermentalgiana TaxID=2315210 RepID=A0A2R5GJ32_9STRA|nr:Hypothetical Protein FCC1311_059592 [Hondaea fermentalgiana]|eukprot:GBG29738.1 Hypothetical Protein FCC1311_059592 [Hondaea fermentalgiana]
MNRKKSNRCCIYHKPKAFDESDSESDDSDEEDEFRKRHPEFAGRRAPSHLKKTRKNTGCGCHSHGHGHGHDDDGDKESDDKGEQDKHSTGPGEGETPEGGLGGDAHGPTSSE